MKDGVRLSAEAMGVVKDRIAGDVPTQETSGLSKREWDEVIKVLRE